MNAVVVFCVCVCVIFSPVAICWACFRNLGHLKISFLCNDTLRHYIVLCLHCWGHFLSTAVPGKWKEKNAVWLLEQNDWINWKMVCNTGLIVHTCRLETVWEILVLHGAFVQSCTCKWFGLISNRDDLVFLLSFSLMLTALACFLQELETWMILVPSHCCQTRKLTD